MSTIKINDIYALPSTTEDLIQISLKGRWIPELSNVIGDWDCPLTEGIVEDNRFVIKTLIDETYDGSRYSYMGTIWFDGKPVLIVQEAGRSGRDHFKRWVTDKDTYVEMLAYLVAMLTENPEMAEDEDFVDPEMEVYPEELLHFYGNSHLQKFGIEPEPAMDGVNLIRNESGLMADLPRDQYLVFLRKFVPDVPEYIRRQGFVLQKVRLLPVDEITASNPRILKVSEDNGEDRVFLYKKATAPAGTYVQPV